MSKVTEKKLLLSINEHLLRLSEEVKNINERLEKIEKSQGRVEEKTDDIHSLVPFGQWFEGFSRRLSRRLSWIGGGEENGEEQPLLLEDLDCGEKAV